MKLKTTKAISKRFKMSKNGKIIKRACGQNHFNSRENGKVGRNKKSDVIVSEVFKRLMRSSLPK